MATLIDLSKTIENNAKDPWFMRVRIKHKAHRQAYWLIRWLVGLPKELFPPGFTGWADDTIVKMGVHATTHIDAPWHYGPLVAGQKARTADQIPLDWCYADGILLNMTHKADNDPITVLDMEQELARSGVRIKPGCIVLIRTDRDRYMGTKEFPDRGTGMSREATLWLIDQGVRVMGIDQWGWDLPLRYMAAQARRTHNPDLFWEAHRVGLEKEYCHIEQLTNLAALPPQGFKVAVFALKLKGASAAPARVVAILDE